MRGPTCWKLKIATQRGDYPAPFSFGGLGEEKTNCCERWSLNWNEGGRHSVPCAGVTFSV